MVTLEYTTPGYDLHDGPVGDEKADSTLSAISEAEGELEYDAEIEDEDEFEGEEEQP